jgi:hypothetical protein
MIKNISLRLGAIILMSLILLSCNENPKKEKIVEEPFREKLAFPSFVLAKMQDSSFVGNNSIPKKGIVMLKYFSPDCDHCQEEATLYVSKKDSLQNIQTVWMSGEWANLADIQLFAETYKLNEVHPLFVGKDMGSNLLLYYDIKGVPFSVVYKDNQLIREYRGDLNFDELIEINNGTYVPQPKDTLIKNMKIPVKGYRSN